jgi:hypothetical protein
MKAVIIKDEDYSAIPDLLCDILWATSHRNWGFEMISRETKREIDKDTMRGILIASFHKNLDLAAKLDD